jgi:hypothetical protein
MLRGLVERNICSGFIEPSGAETQVTAFCGEEALEKDRAIAAKEIHAL